ncbi:AAA family ATPase [Sinanaerobacter chloroacetimidivorans]|jgi:predicted ATPase|uniref:AAA family ATPase n=1 Tax=Sinanaerobacter chloroacetimidivorans TaxID=2818044 RepID=A0A8J8B1Q0_9FIRM|nr:AAA family ATPase [Sinanaerobacter chloroacetimidivorans]MBR0597967.1 AAA family ATPase [Sinanaerobacter chloroacetimidivorans]
MIYLKSFYLPSLDEEELDNPTPHAYPYGIFPYKDLQQIRFRPVTIFYGGNGSGKSTLLNLIAEKLKLPRNTLFNTNSKFDGYVDKFCSFVTETDEDGLHMDIPLGSKIITSEDIFDSILTVRDENQKIDKRKIQQEKEYLEARYGHVRFGSLDDYEDLKKQNAARRQTMTYFVTDRAGKNIDQFSNGETALAYFDRTFESGRLYLLDEPENSLSPKFQLQLAQLITQCAHYLGCQFIIASHSPFILSLEDAQVYDLDSVPARVKEWHQLENMKIYYDLFHSFQHDFQQNDKE